MQPAAVLRRAVNTYLDHLTVERALSVNTLAAYRRDLDRYLVGLAAQHITDLAAVTPRQVASYLADLREGTADRPPLAARSATSCVIRLV